MIARALTVVLACLLFGGAGVRAGSDSPLADAKALYDSASFDEALSALDRYSRAEPEHEVEDVQRYRALCLLALNRTAEAQSALEIVFSRNPQFKLGEGDAPPRMRAAFDEVRRRLLPSVTERLYASAKLSFDRKEYAIASTQFTDLIRFLDDPDARDLASAKEFRTLAVGFRDLSVVAAVTVAAKPEPAPSPAPASSVPPAPVPAPVNAANQTPAQTSPPGVLQPPVIVKQQMPLWLGMRELLPRGGRGMIRIIIDEQGNVEDARIAESVHTVYDALLLSAARTWKYEPARLDGKPVRYVKLIEVFLKPQ